jgi:hypothetical protein
VSEFRILDYNYVFDPSVSITASSEDVNFPASNLTKFQRSRVWRSSGIAATERIVIDLKTPAAIDSFAMIFNPMEGEGIKFSESAVITLKGSATNSWTSPGVSVTPSLNNTYDAITYFFSAPQTYRYWAIEIQDPLNGYGYLEVSKVLLTKATQLGQLPEAGLQDAVSDLSKVAETAYGHRYSDLYPNRRQFDFSYVALTEADTKTLQEIHKRVGAIVPIGVCLDPTETLFEAQRFFLYGYLPDSHGFSNRFYSFFDSTLKLLEAI